MVLGTLVGVGAVQEESKMIGDKTSFPRSSQTCLHTLGRLPLPGQATVNTYFLISYFLHPIGQTLALINAGEDLARNLSSLHCGTLSATLDLTFSYEALID